MEFIDKKINQLLNEELAVYEMALPRKDLVSKVESYSYPLIEHLIKLLIYGKSLGEENYLDWKDNEICGYFAYIYNLTTKSGNGKLKDSDYFNAFVRHQGTSPADYMSTVSLFRINNRKTLKYPDFVPKNEQGIRLHNCYFELLNQVCPILARPLSAEKSAEDFVPVVTAVVEKYLPD